MATRGSVGARLDTAHEALGSGDREAALVALLDAWRESGAAPIADAIDSLSDALTPGEPPIRASGSSSAKKAWYATLEAGRASSMGRLLEALPDGEDRCLRLRRLASLPRDPRIATAARAWLESPPVVGPRRRGFATDLIALLSRTADARIAPLVAQMSEPAAKRATVGTIGVANVPALRTLAQELASIESRPLADAERATLAAIVEQAGRAPARVVRAREADPTALYAAVYARPDDDEARAVLADVLQERGDPRGEHMALQLARWRSDGAPSARERALEATWGRVWLGAIEPHVLAGELVYERGFVARCRFAGGAIADVTAHPEWSTITHLDVTHASQFVGGSHRLTLAPVMRSLRHVVGASREDLEHITACSRALPWVTLGARLWRWDDARALSSGPGDVLTSARSLELGHAKSGGSVLQAQGTGAVSVDPILALLARWPLLESLDVSLTASEGAALFRALDGRALSLRISLPAVVLATVGERALRVELATLGDRIGQQLVAFLGALEGGLDRVILAPEGRVVRSADSLSKGQWQKLSLGPIRRAAEAIGAALETIGSPPGPLPSARRARSRPEGGQ